MAVTKRNPDFLTSDEGVLAMQELTSMVLDENYVTDQSFIANSEKYTDHLIPFIDKHLAYLHNHPATNPQQYLSNLRLITRIRR